MPDAQGNYAGDFAAVLPDNTQNIIHYADQYEKVNQQRALAKAKLAEEQRQQQSDLYDLVGEKVNQEDHPDQNSYSEGTTQAIADSHQKHYKMLSDAAKSGKTINQGELLSSLSNDARQISANDNYATKMDQEIADESKSRGFSPEKTNTLRLLAKHDLYNHTDPTNGVVSKDAKYWNRNLSASDFVNNTMEKHYSQLSEDNLDPGIVAENKKLESQKLEIPTERENGKLTKVGYKASINPNEAVYDKNNQPVFDENGTQIPGREADHTGVKTRQILSPNGQPQTVLAQNIEDSFSASHPMKVWAKTQLATQIGEANMVLQENNKTRLSQGLNPLSLITGDSEQAKHMLSKIYYDKYTQNMPNTPVNKNSEDQRSFENDRQNERDILANKRDNRAEANSNRQEKKMDFLLGKNSAATPIDDFLSETDLTYGKDIKVVDSPAVTGDKHKWNPFKDAEPDSPATYKNVRIIPENVDPRIADIVAGKPDKDGKRRVPPKEFTDENGKPIKGWIYNAATGNATGEDDAEISNREVQRDYLNHNKKGVVEKLPKEKVADKTSPKKEPNATPKILTGNVR